jgi:hypothetical protein
VFEVISSPLSHNSLIQSAVLSLQNLLLTYCNNIYVQYSTLSPVTEYVYLDDFDIVPGIESPFLKTKRSQHSKVLIFTCHASRD